MNPVVHFEMGGTDTNKSSAFYSSLLRWKITDGPTKLIAKTLVGPITIPNGQFAWLNDAMGTTFGLWQAQ